MGEGAAVTLGALIAASGADDALLLADCVTSLGGVPKTSVFDAFLSDEGVSGDAHADTSHHGGPDRAGRIVSAIGAAERELSVGGYAQKILPGRSRPRLSPLSGLSAAWLAAAKLTSTSWRALRLVPH